MSTQILQVDEDECVAGQIARASASMVDMPVDQIPPLENTIDTDLLEMFYKAASAGDLVDGRLVFDYIGLTISLNSDRKLEIN